jgi:nucleoside-diphosphate-sugar epimerase
LILGDLSVNGVWNRALEGVDVVFHLAGKAHALAELKQEEVDYFRYNVEGTANLLRAAHSAGTRRVVLFSSIKAMCRGNAGSAMSLSASPRELSEADASDPDTPYGRSKREAEALVLSGGFIPEPVVLRLCMVYGAEAKGNILKMLDAVRRGRFPSLPEVGNRRSMVHVEDVVNAALLSAQHPSAPGNIFIVSDGVGYSTRKIYELMCVALQKPMPAWQLPIWALTSLGRMGDLIGKARGRRFVFDSDALEKLIGSAWYSSRRIEQQLGFRPQWDLERALPEMVKALSGAGGRVASAP